MLAALIEDREHLAADNSLYQTRFGELDTGTEEGRRARLALLALTDAFVLRAFEFVMQDEGAWHAAMADIQSLMDSML